MAFVTGYIQLQHLSQYRSGCAAHFSFVSHATWNYFFTKKTSVLFIPSFLFHPQKQGCCCLKISTFGQQYHSYYSIYFCHSTTTTKNTSILLLFLSFVNFRNLFLYHQVKGWYFLYKNFQQPLLLVRPHQQFNIMYTICK